LEILLKNIWTDKKVNIEGLRGK